MTDPNKPTQSDKLEIRERMKRWLTPAFVKTIDAGEMDGTGLYQRAEAEMIRERAGEEQGAE